MLDHPRLGFEMEFLSGAYVYRKPPMGAMKRRPTARVTRAVPDKGARGTEPRGTVGSVKKRVESRPEEAASLVEEALLFADRGDYDDAVRKATQAIDLDPTDARAYYILGLIRWNRKEFDVAASQLSRAASLDREFALPRYYLAEISRRRGQTERARELYREAIGILERQPRSRVLWGSDNVAAASLAEIWRDAVTRLQA